MALFLVQAIIPTNDNVQANFATNTWAVDADDLIALQLFFDNLETFYKNLGGFFSSLVRQNGWQFKAYAVSDPEPRAPVLTETWNQTSAPAGTPLPTEVSIVLSFQADQVSGIPQARRRGRIYLPFLETVVAGTDGRPTSSAVNIIAVEGDTLLSASNAAASWTWSVFSRVSPGSFPVTNGWVDNEYDTQRRRGRPSTTRQVFN